MAREILFTGESFVAQVAGLGETRCTPVAYHDDLEYGVGVFFEDGRGEAWGVMTRPNFVTVWRATEVLRRLKVIEQGTLCGAYYTADRKAHPIDQSFREPIIAEIGPDGYAAVMRVPVPDAVVRLILGRQGQRIAPPLSQITDEVRAGTIAWRREFDDFGIKRH